jgi:carbonyl reductase 1
MLLQLVPTSFLLLQRLVLLLFVLLNSINKSTTVLVAAAAMATSSKEITRRVALVTGANKGIGKEIVRLLYNSADNNNNHRIFCTRLDLTDPSSIQSTKELLEQPDVGNGTLDVLINNAAICFNDPTLYGKVAYTPFQQQADITVRTNFFGTLNVTNAMLPLLLRKSSTNPPGRIINIASAAGRLSILKSKTLIDTFTSPNLTVSKLQEIMKDFIQAVQDGSHASKGYPNTCYGMSKCGIIAWTRILAREYQHHDPNNNNEYHQQLLVYSVDPGYCATDQNNHQGIVPAARGAITPVWLATMPASSAAASMSGRHFYQEQEIAW